MNNVKGFSLIELMIVVAIIGVISAIAIPSYDKYMLKSRRVDDGLAHMSKIVDREERFYLQNNIYTVSFGAAGLNMTNLDKSDDGYYEFEITLLNAGQGFSVTATPVAGKAQVNDLDCTSMTLTSTGLKTATGADSTKCW